MSSWKDSSDFASLAAALSKAKPTKAPETKTSLNLNTETNAPGSATEKDISSLEDRTFKFSDFQEDPTLPLKDSTIFKLHKSTVSALEFESSGSRFLSGSHDTTVAYWDFNGMVKDQPEPFRFIEPMGSYTVRFYIIIV